MSNTNNYSRAEINLPLYNMYDDFNNCIEINGNDNIIIHKTIQNYIDLLSSTINILHTIKSNIPENRNDFVLECDNGLIRLYGDTTILEDLETLGHVYINHINQEDHINH
jgi:hypothetical protein